MVIIMKKVIMRDKTTQDYYGHGTATNVIIVIKMGKKLAGKKIEYSIVQLKANTAMKMNTVK